MRGMADQLIAIIPKNAIEAIHVQLRQYKGRNLIDIRVFYQDDAGTWHPTRKGVCVTAELWPELRDALLQIDTHLPDQDTYPEREGRSLQEILQEP